MFNRFNCVLDADLFHQYKENNRSLVCSDKALVTVEIREGSVKGRMSNVNNHRNESQYYIALATNDDNSNAEELPLDDLLIGMQYNQLYIKSKRLGKRCKVRQNCMVNPSSLSEVSQLLMQISSDEETSIIWLAFLFSTTVAEKVWHRQVGAPLWCVMGTLAPANGHFFLCTLGIHDIPYRAGASHFGTVDFYYYTRNFYSIRLHADQ